MPLHFIVGRASYVNDTHYQPGEMVTVSGLHEASSVGNWQPCDAKGNILEDREPPTKEEIAIATKTRDAQIAADKAAAKKAKSMPAPTPKH